MAEDELEALQRLRREALHRLSTDWAVMTMELGLMRERVTDPDLVRMLDAAMVAERRGRLHLATLRSLI